ncbi:hypothetical protein [Mycobacterium sp. Marseille-P9652]|uniref:hypothetical protein n=1 Tax=Mycobacterium sp. Marseille-P9652 TaxID=2654950 RepID=UPI0012E7D2CE|nr:hypothetical protein [Mycobacterium sp. Marseille-P9652]
MRSSNTAIAATLVAAGMVSGLGSTPSAWAFDPAVNGTYTATVVGDWAQTKGVYHQEAVVRSTWTITSSCYTAQDCKGQVVSDQGWSAPLHMHDGQNWYVKRDIPNWERCPDGSSFTGTDYIYFYPANPDTGEISLGSTVMAGKEKTVGPVGVCGSNAPLWIEQPFRLDRIG